MSEIKVKAMAGEGNLVFRDFERRDDKGVWHKVECEHLVKGDIFRSNNPDGSPVGYGRIAVPFHPIDAAGSPLQPSETTALTNWACTVDMLTETEAELDKVLKEADGR